MFSSFKEGGSEERANSTSGLVSLLVSSCIVLGDGLTYTDNGDFPNGVGDARGLILSV